jgi:hypothetical protein
MEVSGQLHAPTALPPLKQPPGTHWIGWVGPRVGLDAVEKGKILHCHVALEMEFLLYLFKQYTIQRRTVKWRYSSMHSLCVAVKWIAPLLHIRGVWVKISVLTSKYAIEVRNWKDWR